MCLKYYNTNEVGDSMKKILISILFVLTLVGCEKKETKEVEEKKPEAIVELENKEVEVNEEFINTSGIVKTENCELITTEEKVDTSVLGEKDITIVVKDLNDKEKEYTYKLNVKDTVAPTINYKEKITITEGNRTDLLKGVSVTDNSKEQIKVTVEGKYDFNKVGTYKLQYVAKDSSGNETKKDFSLIVNAKPVVVEKKEDTNTGNKTSSGNKSNTTSSSSGSVNGTSSSLNGTKTSKGYTITVKNGITYIDGVMIVNKTYPLPKSYVPSNTHGKLKGSYSEILKDGIVNYAYSAYTEMKNAASSAGYTISIASGYRSYGYQEGLYNGYVRKNGKADADLGSARPGHSEHQTGLAFDLNTISHSSANTNTTKWVLSNCYKYGFILRYPSSKTGSTGYKYEWWHLRYVGKDLAAKLYNGGNWITLEEYFGITSKYNY